MCTVTFIPNNQKAIITSNRDEKYWRSIALPPQPYPFKSGNIFFPKDEDAGGTWFAVHENGNTIVFLNGAFVKHEPNPPYRKSRGIILLDILDTDQSIQTSFSTIDLTHIEPFTAILFNQKQLFECRWDGKQKYQRMLNIQKPYIWSSATLYDENIIQKRENWFQQWLQNNPKPTQEDLLYFHQFTGDGDQHNDLCMNRDGKVSTVSITSLAFDDNEAKLQYIDLKKNQTTTQKIILKRTFADV